MIGESKSIYRIPLGWRRRAVIVLAAVFIFTPAIFIAAIFWWTEIAAAILGEAGSVRENLIRAWRIRLP